MNEQWHYGGAFVNSDSVDSCGGVLDLSELEQELWHQLDDINDDDYISYDDYLMIQESRICGQTFLPFVAKRVNRRLYTKGKTNYTKCRIAGSVLHILGSNKVSGARTHITCARIQSYTGLSESTIRRHLYDVLDWLVREGRLLLEIETGKGYYVYTQQWKDMVGQHGDMFDAKRLERSPWLTRKQRESLETTPCQNLPSDSLRGSKDPKNKKINKRAMPRALAKVARNLLYQHTLPKYDRVKVDDETKHWIAWRLLTDGYWRKDVITIMNRAMRAVDAAVADFDIGNPVGYLIGKINTIKLTFAKPTTQTIKNERSRFWYSQLSDYAKMIDAYPDITGTEEHHATMNYLNRKLADS